MNETGRDGVVYIEKPITTNFLVLSGKHPKSDFIVEKDFASDPRNAMVYVYASGEEYNLKLYEVFQRRFANGDCVLVRHAGIGGLDFV